MKEKYGIILLCLILIALDIRYGSLNESTIVTMAPFYANAEESTIISEERFMAKKGQENRISFTPMTDSVIDEDSVYSDTPRLYSLSACLLDAKNGRVLYGKKENDKRAMASTTKILTCLLAIENCSLDEVVEVSSYAASMPDVQLGIIAGEKYLLKDLLFSLMLESHNDTAVAIAEHVGGSAEGFSEMMNERAQKMGCVDSTFLTPNGLDKVITEENTTRVHSTTARELAIILSECIQNETFLSICRTEEAVITNLSKSRSFHLSNHNTLLKTMHGAIAGKTGFTCNAGYCYVGAVERNDNTYICALLGCGWPNNKNYKWYDMNVLIDYAETAFQNTDIDEKLVNQDWIESVPIVNGIKDGILVKEIPLNYEEMDTTSELLVGEGEVLQVLYELPKELLAPISSGESIGQIRYLINGQTVKTDRLTAQFSIDSIKISDLFHFVLQKFLGLY